MQSLKDYLTEKGWKQDLEETRAHVKKSLLTENIQMLLIGTMCIEIGSMAHYVLNILPNTPRLEEYVVCSRVLEYADKDKDGKLSGLEKDLLATHLGYSPAEFYAQQAARAHSGFFLPSMLKKHHFERALHAYQTDASDENNNKKLDSNEKSEQSRKVKHDALLIEKRINTLKDAPLSWTAYIFPGVFWLTGIFTYLGVGLEYTINRLDKLLVRCDVNNGKDRKRNILDNTYHENN